MEYLLLGLLGFAMVIGSLVGFFSMFTKGEQASRLRRIENELQQLKNQLAAIERGVKPSEEGDKIVQAVAETQAKAALSLGAYEDQLLAEAEDDAQLKATLNDDTHVVIKETPPTEYAKIISEPKAEPWPDTHVDTPSEPNFLERGFDYAKNWLLGGNTLVRSGVVILFIGVAFLLKFAVDNNFIPIELRLSAVALLGLGLLTIGWRLREQRTEYAWAMQGGGIGVLYLTIFAAMKLYALIPAGAAFALLIVIAFLSAAIAVLQSAMPLAILGFTGGFLAPIFTSTGHGSHVGLFSYYLVLNLAIAFIAYHKSWRPLNVLGFAFTFIIGTLWGAKSYAPEYFASTEPFLIIHFLLFTLIAVLYAFRQSTKASDYVDATLVFGTPIVGFSLQYALLKDSPFGMAYSALALGLFYIALASWVLTRKRDTLQFLGECFLALGIGFATLTLPLALDGRWTSAAWAVEGVGLVWVGLRQHRSFPLFTGLVLQLLAAIAFVYGWGITGHTGATNQNLCLGVAFIALSGWACGAQLNAANRNKALSTLLAIWGWAWWAGAGLTAIDEFLPAALFAHAALVFIVLTSIVLPMLSAKLKWPMLASLARLLLPTMVFVLIFDVFDSHPFDNIGLYSWLISYGAYAVLLKRNVMPQSAIFRAALLWIAALIGGIEWQHYLSYQVHDVWLAIGWGIVPMLISAGVMAWQKQKSLTTASANISRAWLLVGLAPLMLFLCAWFIFMSLDSDGSAAPLPYIPLINPLDITLAAILLMLLIWERNVRPHFYRLETLMPKIVGIMGFALLNGILLRSLHHAIATPFQWSAIFDYPVLQMSFTFLWAVTAFILMLLAKKREERPLWIAGAGLMGLVVAKIFLLDLAQHGTVERIASFIGAGLMLLVMGYFVPLPPAQKEAENNKESAA